MKTTKKLKCESNSKCVAYTFEQSQLICILHSSTNKGQKYTRGKQTGVKKTDYKLSLAEISLCSDKNRQRRCRREPKCNHVDCFRNAQDFLTQVVCCTPCASSRWSSSSSCPMRNSDEMTIGKMHSTVDHWWLNECYWASMKKKRIWCWFY